ncbi:heterokaryon incompatibility protein-domain-containing protein, partial [Echria macrotheca]
MRLLEITNRDPRKVIPRIVNFPGNCEGLRYAILSHTWREEEVTLQDMERGSGPHMKGYNKIAEFYYRARADGFEYVWIDTCCIDKKDSTELHEAINSMFRWYQEAVVCYAYLDDVDEVADSNSTDSEADPIHPFVREPTPRWFTRGWTLQELLAPKEVEFFDKDWNHMGRRSELKEEISMAAGIDPEALVSRSGTWHQYSVAQRMSWAARRTTTREEDGAYCLMGLFGVNMPLVYGEGSGAFKRLQAEIMALSDDLSIFAWMADKGCHPQLPCSDASGLLAPSPRAFAGCRGV